MLDPPADACLLGAAVGLGDHSEIGIYSDDLTSRADALGQGDRIRPWATADIQHLVAGLQPHERVAPPFDLND